MNLKTRILRFYAEIQTLKQTAKRIHEFTKNIERFRWDFKNPRMHTQTKGVLRQEV